ncbi:ThrRS/AlaRS common domain-containing protein [Macrolepiota fuliginosa MF-IS2]|uniref:ThrRS/AlaRS common domain-containing protein n=1 Tax=Macrolepiota fuliginosa MF-IS2 TaxID=1400762 RepID=A0A9P5XJA8_9AGAR|nr:ThrRS/AlaRS common domain-containing protein [Macrolepiota fuliginosa MF-IS2]
MATTLVLTQTPTDYHRIVSPTLKIPDIPELPIPVGILACQRDPLRRSISTTVISTELYQPPPSGSGKKGKKAVVAPTLPSDPIVLVTLHDTVIFPEGGGQPTDTGLITTAGGKQWEVIQCKRHGGQAVHYIRVKDSTVDAALAAFTSGASVTAELGAQDFERRYDHMSMHTSQHLLSALLETRLNLPTLSWSLTSYPQPCYVELPRGMSQEEIFSIQSEANKLVFEGRRVHVEVQELDRETDSVSQSVPKLENGRTVGKALPEDYTGGVKRVVVIDGVDRNPCCGTHLPSIHNLQLFLLPHTESLSRKDANSGSTTTVRLYFLCGPRLIHHLTTTHSLLASTASILSSGLPVVPERVQQVVDERKKADKRVSDVESELAVMIGKGLIDELIKGTQETIEGVGLWKKHLHRTDDSSNPLTFLSSIAFVISDEIKARAATTPYLIVLSSSPSAQTPNGLSTVLVVGSDDKRVKEAGDALKVKLGIKGGGKGPRWSGKFTGVWKDTKETVLVQEVLTAICS